MKDAGIYLNFLQKNLGKYHQLIHFRAAGMCNLHDESPLYLNLGIGNRIIRPTFVA